MKGEETLMEQMYLTPEKKKLEEATMTQPT